VRKPDGLPLGTEVDGSEGAVLDLDVEIFREDKDLTLGFRLYSSAHEAIYRSLATDSARSPVGVLPKGLHRLSCELPLGFLRTGTYVLNVDASLHCREWIVNPERDKEYSVSFAVMNGSFGARHSTTCPVAPDIQWRLASETGRA
jgi:hypothetical protein